MKANDKYLNLPKSFWANVRSISQRLGYTERGQGRISVHTAAEMAAAMKDLGLESKHLTSAQRKPTALGKKLHNYFKYRANRLNNYVEPRLMYANRARKEYGRLRRALKPTCPIPLNKQKGSKRAKAYLTCIVNMLIEANAKGLPCDYNPLKLTTFTRGGKPLRTLARRIDGAFPSTVNPIAVWEVKEYYYTTTFGSRVADVVYEMLLDGMELAELYEHEGIEVNHYLIVDTYYTWWECGRSYLCRIFDMLHMGYVDEVLSGYEVIGRLPAIVKDWVKVAKSRRVIS